MTDDPSLADSRLAASREANRRLWNAWTDVHVASDFYDVDAFLAGECKLKPIEVEEVGDVRGLDLVHLQCHFGLDTLSWARRGARVAGVDLSDRSIEEARALATSAGLDAEFVCADVYDAPRALGGRTFDVVVTGYGALNWLPDVDRWARVVAELLRPGGFVHVVEFHPVLFGFADGPEVAFERPYVWRAEPVVWPAEGTYADRRQVIDEEQHEWNHPIGDVVTALAGAGLALEFLHEHPRAPYGQDHLEWIEARDDGWFEAPNQALPLVYSVRAAKPGP